MTNSEKLYAFIRNNPRSTFKDCQTFAIQDKALLTVALIELVETGQVEKSGFGMGDAPFVYSVVEEVTA